MAALAARAAACQECDLWARATQTVFGEGPATADLVMVGEQPGDREDIEGHPFVGPAGRVLDDALVEAGINREAVYVTNAVKHFKWQARGKRRIHDRPNRAEVVACHHWLAEEVAAIDPSVIVALGATAGQSLFGGGFRLGAARGQLLDIDGTPVVATNHPSAILRADAGEARAKLYAAFVDDLRRAASMIAA